MSSQYKQQLCTSIDQAIQNSIHQTSSGTKKSEPEYIADLTDNLPQNLISVLNQNNNGKHYKIASCFIHQKPIVEFLSSIHGSYKKPELGDLLLLYKDIKSNGKINYNALLLQAKKGSSTKPNKIQTQDLHQLKLYTEWPVFKYHRANNKIIGIDLNGEERSVYPKAPHPGAQYLIIDESTSQTFFFCAEPNTEITATNSLGETIFDFIHFQTGRTFEYLNGTGIFPNHYHNSLYYPNEAIYGWTRVINDFFIILKGISFSLNRNKNYGNRLNDPYKLFSFLDIDKAPLDSSDNNNSTDNYDKNNGMGVILIESSVSNITD